MQADAPERNSGGGLRRELKALEALSLSVAMISPVLALAAFAGAPAVYVGRAAPLAFILAGVGIGLIACSFIYLCRYYNNAGSAYGLAGSALGPRSGFFAGWAMLFPYAIWGASSAAIAGYFITLVLHQSGLWTGADYWPFAVAFALINAVLATRAVRLVGRTLISIEGLSLIVMLVVVVVIVVKLVGGYHGHKVSASVFTLPHGSSIHLLILASVFGVTSFAGFEGAASLGEETLNPRRNVPRAISLAVAGAAVLFVIVVAVISMAFGTTKADGSALAASSGPLFALSRQYLFPAAAYVLEIGAAVSAFSAGLANMSGAGRMIYALTRDGAPRSPLTRLGRYGEPTTALMFVLVLDLAIIIVLRAIGTTGLDAAFYLGTAGTLALIVAYGMVTVAAGKHMLGSLRGPRRLSAIVPAAGLALIVYILYNEVYPAPPSPYDVFPYVVAGWLVVGAAIVAFSPGLARRLGLGLAATLAREPGVSDDASSTRRGGGQADEALVQSGAGLVDR